MAQGDELGREGSWAGSVCWELGLEPNPPHQLEPQGGRGWGKPKANTEQLQPDVGSVRGQRASLGSTGGQGEPSSQTFPKGISASPPEPSQQIQGVLTPLDNAQALIALCCFQLCSMN